MLPCVYSIMDHRWRQNVVKTKSTTRGAAEFALDMLTTFCRLLWSTAVQRHRSIEFIWATCRWCKYIHLSIWTKTWFYSLISVRAIVNSIAPWDWHHAPNRLIDSNWNLQCDSSIPKAKFVDQSQLISTRHANCILVVDKLGTVSTCRERQ